MKTFGKMVIALLLVACIGPTPTRSPISPIATPMIIQRITSKIGLHIVPGRRTGFGLFLMRLASEGIQLSVVKAIDDLSPLHEVKLYMPSALTVGRLNSIRDPITGVSYDLQAFKPSDFPSARAAAKTYYSLVLPTWTFNSQVDVWETFNEFSSDWGWQSEFFIEIMKLADRDSFTLALYAFSTGNPPLDSATINEIAPALQYAAAHGHYLSLHEYGGVGAGNPDTLRGSYLALRYRQLYAMLPADARPRLIISEAGQSAGFEFIGVQPFIDDVGWYDLQLAEDGYIVGAAMWTLGNYQRANFQEALPALADYIISLVPLLPYRIYLPFITMGRET
ncbi:MAG TPA: hypothetical protein VII92_19095 [Anaerolineae bacterium]